MTPVLQRHDKICRVFYQKLSGMTRRTSLLKKRSLYKGKVVANIPGDECQVSLCHNICVSKALSASKTSISRTNGQCANQDLQLQMHQLVASSSTKAWVYATGLKPGTHPSLKGPCADAGRSLFGERRRRCLQGLPPAAMISKGFAPSWTGPGLVRLPVWLGLRSACCRLGITATACVKSAECMAWD